MSRRHWHRGLVTSLRDDNRALVEDTGIGFIIEHVADGDLRLATEERFDSFKAAETWADENIPRGPITYPVPRSR